MFSKPYREVNRVFIHCSDSDYEHHDNVKTIWRWHVMERGFSGIGYHYIITKDGQVHNGRGLEMQPAAQKGHNLATIAICLTGKDMFSAKQKKSLYDLCAAINDEYSGEVTFHGHREVSNKTCPNFEYKSVLFLDLEGRMNKPLHKPKVTKRSFWAIILGFFKGEK